MFCMHIYMYNTTLIYGWDYHTAWIFLALAIKSMLYFYNNTNNKIDNKCAMKEVSEHKIEVRYWGQLKNWACNIFFCYQLFHCPYKKLETKSSYPNSNIVIVIIGFEFSWSSICFNFKHVNINFWNPIILLYMMYQTKCIN